MIEEIASTDDIALPGWCLTEYGDHFRIEGAGTVHATVNYCASRNRLIYCRENVAFGWRDVTEGPSDCVWIVPAGSAFSADMVVAA